MTVRLLYHDPDNPTGISPFDQAIVEICRADNVCLACPYLSIKYLERVTRLSKSWRLLTDVQEWLRFQGQKQRKLVYDFLFHERDRVRDYPRLHAKIAVGSSSAMLESANFTVAGIQRRPEVSVLFQDEPQVQELSKWFEDHWTRAYELDEARLKRITAFMRSLPHAPVVEETPNLVVSPPISSEQAKLVQLPGGASRTYGSQNEDIYYNFGHQPGWREWEDARKYNFICAGGGPKYSGPLKTLAPGDRVWVYAPRNGYVGVARVKGFAEPASRFRVKTSAGKMRPIMDVVAASEGYHHDKIRNPKLCEYFVPVQWLQTVSVEEPVKGPGFFAIEHIVCRPTSARWRETLKHLKKSFPYWKR